MNAHGTVALVTGGAIRIGRAIVLELAGAGCDVAVHARRSLVQARKVADEVERLGRRSCVITADLHDPREWPRLVTECVSCLGRLDILVNNASEFKPDQDISNEDQLVAVEGELGSLRERNGGDLAGHQAGGAAFESNIPRQFPLEHWERTLRVNLVAAAGLAHYAVPHLAAGGAGKIVNLGDISAERPWSGFLAYCASKAGITSLTRGLALSLAPRVQVNGIAPGIALFPDHYSTERREELVRRVPLRREGSPRDIARTVRFLVEHGDYITGAVIPVDGGRGVV